MRYSLIVSMNAGAHPELRVVERNGGNELCRWCGYVARCLLGSAALPPAMKFGGCHPCDQPVVWRLALEATSAETTMQGLSPLHRLVADTLLANPAWHHSADDLRCLLGLRSPALPLGGVQRCLDDLVTLQMIQRIVVDAHNVFYDVDLRPHGHVFDPVSRSLRDA